MTVCLLSTNQLYSLSGQHGEMYEVELAMAERVSGRHRRLAVAEQLRSGGSGRTPSATKERATAPAFSLYALSTDLRISSCVFPWQGEISARHVTKRNQIDGITKETSIWDVLSA